MNVADIMGYGLLAMGALVILSNWYYLLQALIRRGSTSFTLLLGGVFGTLGVLLSNIPNAYFWVPILLDFTIPIVFATFFIKSEKTERGSQENSSSE